MHPASCAGDYDGYQTESDDISSKLFRAVQYEIIEGEDDHKIKFWHDNINVRNKVSRASRNHELLSGVINFGNETGYSDLMIQVDGSN